MSEDALLRPHMPELDTLRGIAVFMVVSYHALYWSSSTVHLTHLQKYLVLTTYFGMTGVNLFFVLSGFLITGILLDGRNQPHYFRRFYSRRALRILPPYLAVLLVVAALPPHPWRFVALSLAFSSNLAPLFHLTMAYGPLWSLAVEEHFYLLWPACVRRMTPGILAGTCAAILVVSPALRALSYRADTFGPHWYSWLVADGLAMGALTAILLRTRRFSRRAAVYFAASCGLLAMLTAAIAVLTGHHTLVSVSRQSALGAALPGTGLAFIYTGVLVAFLLVGSSRRRRWVQAPALQFLGRISYGLYLYHLLVFAACAWIFRFLGADLRVPRLYFSLAGIETSAAIALAWWSRTHFESVFLAMKSRVSGDRPPRRTVPALAVSE